MPKTQFIDGQSLVTASFLNKIFRTDGGHKHDGIDADGHAGKIDINTEVTVGVHGSLAAPVDTTDLHVIRHDHAGSGNAILQTDVLRLHGAPRDATRRAQAPLAQSLYTQNVPKILYRARITTVGTPPVTDVESYNVNGGLAPNPDDSQTYTITPLDAGALGVVIATFEGFDLGEPIDPARVLAYWDGANGRVVICPWLYQGGAWKRLRDGGATISASGLYYLQIAVW